MFRRISALILCFVMLSGMLPVSVFAQESVEPESTEIATQPQETAALEIPTEETTTATVPVQEEPVPTDAAQTEPASEETVPSGSVPTEAVPTEPNPTEAAVTDESANSVSELSNNTCGANLTWTYADGTLTISGSGTMSGCYPTQPWADYCETITNVVIESGVTSIAYMAFVNCSALTSVSIPDSVTVIDGSAFNNCSSLTAVNLPDGITTIGSYAFSHCSSLTSLAIPESVSSIGSGAFTDCSSMTAVNIPGGITTIESCTFSNCSGLTSLTIPESVTFIGDSAFSGCSKLTAITIPDGITSISKSVFFNCSSLTEISIPEGVTSIGDLAFFNCKGLNTIHIPATVVTIGASDATLSPFTCCPSSIIIYCAADSIPDGWSTYWNYYNNSNTLTTYWGYSKLDLTFWDSLDTSAESVLIPDGVTYIPDRAFKDFTNLKSVYIPASVTEIQIEGYSYESPFYGCSSDVVIYCEASSKPAGWSSYWNRYSSGSGLAVNYGWSAVDYSFWPALDTSAEIIVLPDGITFIPEEAFSNCSNLKYVYIPDSVVYIPGSSNSSYYDTPFFGCDSNIVVYCEADSEPSGWREYWYAYHYDGHGIGLLRVHYGHTLTDFNYWITVDKTQPSITIPAGITQISDGAFSGCTNLTEITIPDTVTAIGSSAFHGCTGLTNAVIPESVTKIGWGAFEACTGLTEITIPNGVTTICESAFRGCTGLTEITVPSSVSSIGSYAFYDCTGLTDVYFEHTSADTLTMDTRPFYIYNYGYTEISPINLHVPTIRDIHPAIQALDGTDRIVTWSYTGNIPVTSISLAEANSTTLIEAGLDLNFTASLAPADATSELVWTASNDGIVKETDYVSGTATVIGTKPGIMVVRCESADDSAVFAEYQVEILHPTAEVERITIRSDTPYPNEVEVGTKAQMIADIYPGNAANKDVIWTLENGTGTAILDENGMLTALTTGTVSVRATATDGTEVIGSQVIRIVDYADSFTILFNNQSVVPKLGVGETVIVSTDSDVDVAWSWTSNDGDLTYATNSWDSGRMPIMGKTAGKVTLTATAQDSNQFSVSVELEVVGEKASYAVEGGNIYYNTVTGAIVDSDETVTVVHIPAKINGTTITSIAPYAFALDGYYNDNNSKLTTVTMAGTVTSIGDHAFYRRSGLTSIIIGAGVTTIGDEAFYGCALPTLTIPANVRSVGKDAFEYVSTKNLTIPGELDMTGGMDSYLSLDTVTITGKTIIAQPGELHVDGDYSWWEVFRLPGRNAKEVIISDSVTTIENYAFRSCSDIEKVTMGNGVINVGRHVFSECYQLEEVTLSNNLTAIGYGMFYHCQKLTSVTIPDSVTLIDTGAFTYCTSMTDVTLGSNVGKIMDTAFTNCETLVNINLPDSLTYIGKDAFYYCNELQLFDLSAIPDTITMQNHPMTASLVDIPDVYIRCIGANMTPRWYARSVDGEPGYGWVDSYRDVKDPTLYYCLYVSEPGKLEIEYCDDYTGARGSKVITCELGLEIVGPYTDTLASGGIVLLSAVRFPENLREAVTWSLRPEDQKYATLYPTYGDTTLLTANSVTQRTEIQITATSDNPNEAPETFTLYILPDVSQVVITDAEGNIVGKTGTSAQTIKVDLAETNVLTLSATTYPEDASKDVYWGTNNYNIVEFQESPAVDGGASNSIIRLNGTGTVTLTAYAANNSRKNASVKLEIYYLDTAKKLTATTSAPAYGLESGSSAEIRIFGSDKNVPLDPDAFTYSVAAGQEDMASVDENGIITAGSMAGTVKITAALKGDPQGRTVAISVKIVPAQTESVLLTATADAPAQIVMLDANGAITENPEEAAKYRVYLSKDDVKNRAFPITVTPVVTDTNGNPMYVSKTSLKWATTDKRVAAVSANEDGSATVTVPAKTDGACVITAVSADLAKIEGTLEIFVRDYTPRLESASLTVNSNLLAGVSTGLISSYGNEIESVAFTDPAAPFTCEYADGILTIIPKDVLKNGTYKLTVKATCKDFGPFELPLTVKVANKLPALTVKQNGKFDLFYKNSTANFQITVKDETILYAEIDPESNKSFYTAGYDDSDIMTVKFTQAHIDGTAGKLSTKATVLVHLEGYRVPLKKSVSIATATSKPAVTLTPASSVINTATAGEHSTVIRAYNKTTGTYVTIQPETVTAAFADISPAGDGVKLRLTKTEGKTNKGGTATILVQDSDWMQPIKLTHKVTVQTKLPTVNLSASTLTLNRFFTKQTASVDITLNQQNMSIGKIEIESADKAEKQRIESAKIAFELNGNTVTFKLDKGNLPKSGTYTFRAIVTLADGTELAAKAFKVSVGSTVPGVKLKTSTLRLNKTLGAEYAAAWSEFVLTKGDGYEIAGFVLPEGWSNSDISIEYRDGMVYAKLLRDDAANQKHVVNLTPILRHIATGEESLLAATVKLTIQVEKKALSVNVATSGKLDASLPDSAITYTVKSFTNVNGTPTAVALEGAHAHLFKATLDTDGSSSVVTLKMRADQKYNLKTSYKVDLVFTICGQTVRKSVSFKIAQSSLKFAAVKAINLYQSQSQAVTATITVTAPAGAKIDQVTLNAKSALQFRRALGNGSMTVTPIGDGSRALVSFTLEHPGYLTYGKSYNLVLDVTPVSTADTPKSTQLKLTVKSCK